MAVDSEWERQARERARAIQDASERKLRDKLGEKKAELDQPAGEAWDKWGTVGLGAALWLLGGWIATIPPDSPSGRFASTVGLSVAVAAMVVVFLALVGVITKGNPPDPRIHDASDTRTSRASRDIAEWVNLNASVDGLHVKLNAIANMIGIPASTATPVTAASPTANPTTNPTTQTDISSPLATKNPNP